MAGAMSDRDEICKQVQILLCCHVKINVLPSTGPPANVREHTHFSSGDRESELRARRVLNSSVQDISYFDHL